MDNAASAKGPDLSKYVSDLQKISTAMDRIRSVSPAASDTSRFLNTVEQQHNRGQPMQPQDFGRAATSGPVQGFTDEQQQQALRNIGRQVFTGTSFAQPSHPSEGPGAQRPELPPHHREPAADGADASAGAAGAAGSALDATRPSGHDLDTRRALQAEPGPPPAYPAAEAQGNQLA
jgi:hypothetical protein